MSNNELRGHGEFLRGQAKSFLSDFEGYAFDFENDATGSDGEDVTHGVTLTLTHADVGRFLRDGFIREDANPALAFTLHVARHCDTSGFDLATRDPVCAEALDAEATKSELIAALGIALAAALLRAAELCSFRL